jgi:hypothetical protein
MAEEDEDRAIDEFLSYLANENTNGATNIGAGEGAGAAAAAAGSPAPPSGDLAPAEQVEKATKKRQKKAKATAEKENPSLTAAVKRFQAEKRKVTQLLHVDQQPQEKQQPIIESAAKENDTCTPAMTIPMNLIEDAPTFTFMACIFMCSQCFQEVKNGRNCVQLPGGRMIMTHTLCPTCANINVAVKQTVQKFD